jgi:hypothetical protein
MVYFLLVVLLGGVSERFKEPVLKTGDFVRGPWVRIPPPPPAEPRSRSTSGIAADVGVMKDWV